MRSTTLSLMVIGFFTWAALAPTVVDAATYRDRGGRAHTSRSRYQQPPGRGRGQVTRANLRRRSVFAFSSRDRVVLGLGSLAMLVALELSPPVYSGIRGLFGAPTHPTSVVSGNGLWEVDRLVFIGDRVKATSPQLAHLPLEGVKAPLPVPEGMTVEELHRLIQLAPQTYAELSVLNALMNRQGVDAQVKAEAQKLYAEIAAKIPPDIRAQWEGRLIAKPEAAPPPPQAP